MKVSEWHGEEWKKRKPSLLKKFENDVRLKPWNYCTITRNKDKAIIIRAPALNLEWHDSGFFYVWVSSENVAKSRRKTPKINLDTILYAKKVIDDWAKEQDTAPLPLFTEFTRGQNRNGRPQNRRKAGQGMDKGRMIRASDRSSYGNREKE